MSSAGVPKKRRRWIWWVVLAVVAVVVIGIAVSTSLSSSSTQASYTTATVKRGTLTGTVSGSGNLVAADVTQVQPGITGTVEDLSVALGDTVKADQLLFRIVNPDLDAAVTRRRPACCSRSRTSPPRRTRSRRRSMTPPRWRSPRSSSPRPRSA
jgi:HlyD family secretion protein